MNVRFYNTLTNQLETFEPIDPPNVYMYNCGPTVYDYAHIGNFRAFVFADVLRRFLELVGYNVHQVMNITDVGHMTEDDVADGGGVDKMEAAGQRLAEAKKAGKLPADVEIDPHDPYQIARYYTNAFIEDAKKLGIKVAFDYDKDPAKTQMPHATDHVVNDMIPLIARLIETKHAYVGKDGAVYYDVQSFPDYGKLSGNTLDKLRGGAGGRVADANQAAKKHPADFLLWKPDPRHLMKWPSPWGEGYPGWHIECSAMARSLLGRDVIDIHTGGEDNIFPHHECEIAQTRGATGEPYFARFWMHTRFLLVEGEKMSKSKGNFYTVRDVLEGKVTGRPVDPAVLRYELLKSHYRNNANFTKKGLEDSARAVERLRDWDHRHGMAELMTGARQADWAKYIDYPEIEEALQTTVMQEFLAALADDLNVSAAVAVIFGWLKSNPSSTTETTHVFTLIDYLLQFREQVATGSTRNVVPSKEQKTVSAADVRVGTGEEPVTEKTTALDAARAAKDFAKADAIRQELIDAGYDVQTTKDGTVARKKLA